jgi:hypothetical protein
MMGFLMNKVMIFQVMMMWKINYKLYLLNECPKIIIERSPDLAKQKEKVDILFFDI